MSPETTPKFATLAVHAGQEPDPATGAVIPPVHLSSTYRQSAIGEHKGFEYQRSGNPTRAALEAQVAALEGAAWGLGYASGLAAVDGVGRLLRPGDRVVLMSDVYGGTHRYFSRVLADFGISVETRDLTDPTRWRFRNTSMVWVESPTNPWLRVVDLQSVARRAHDAGALVVVDNTFASPYLTRPLEHGADLVLHSATKYLGGHSDLVLGLVAGNLPELRERLAFYQNAAGAVPGPFECWLATRGIKTLALRMERHSASALELARRLERHPAVLEVIYPGLESHAEHGLAERQMRSPDGRPLYGGMVSVRLRDVGAARRLAESTRVFALAESLGGVESLIELPALMTHQSVSGTALEVPADLVRLSVGIEDVDDLWQDLERALGSAASTAAPAAQSEPAANQPTGEEPALPAQAEPAPPAPDQTEPEPQPAPEPEPVEPDEPQGAAKGFEPAAQDPTAGMSVAELERYARLRDWRNAEAANQGVSRFIIASNALLASLARTNPRSDDELGSIKGMGPERGRKYGARILEVLGS